MALEMLEVLKFYASGLLKNKEYLSLNTSAERYEFILRFVKPLRQYREEVYEKADTYREKHRKCLEKSMKLRAEGRTCFINKEYDSAVNKFTKAILLAPFPSEQNDSKELSLAFASRSIANFQLKNYSNALFDANNSIDLCETSEMFIHSVHCLRLSNRYNNALNRIDEIIAKTKAEPKPLVLKNITIDDLMEVKRSIVRKMYESYSAFGPPKHYIDQSIDTIEEESDQSSSYFWIHPNCELRKSERKGRHYVAKEDIPANTIVMIDRPISVCLYDKTQLTLCTNCHKHIGARIWPCVGCDEVVFCDKHCAAEAYNAYHKYECGFTGLLFELGAHVKHVFRLLTKFGTKFTIDFELKNINVFDFFQKYIESENEEQNEKNKSKESRDLMQFQAYCTLISHFESSKADKYSTLFKSFKAIELALLFQYSKQFKYTETERDFESFINFICIISKNMSRVLSNVFGWFDCLSSNPLERTHVANAVCVVGSLTNHSCEPNTYWAFVNQKITFKTKFSVKAGDEINITYGPTSLGKPFAERQQKLKTNYHFDCSCVACLRDIRTVLALRCTECSGPVVYEAVDQHNCLLCGQEVADIGKSMAKLEGNKDLFEQMIRNLESDSNKEFSIIISEKALKNMIELVYSESEKLLSYIRQLIRVYVRFERFDKAVEYCLYFRDSIYSEAFARKGLISPNSVNILDDLLLWTNCYYMYLNKRSVVESKHWDMCFDVYSRLIQMLDCQKNIWDEGLAEGEGVLKTLADTVDEIDGKDSKHQLIRAVIRLKEDELTELREWRFLVS